MKNTRQLGEYEGRAAGSAASRRGDPIRIVILTPKPLAGRRTSLRLHICRYGRYPLAVCIPATRLSLLATAFLIDTPPIRISPKSFLCTNSAHSNRHSSAPFFAKNDSRKSFISACSFGRSTFFASVLSPGSSTKLTPLSRTRKDEIPDYGA